MEHSRKEDKPKNPKNLQYPFIVLSGLGILNNGIIIPVPQPHSLEGGLSTHLDLTC